MKFWTSDTHFGHKNIMAYCNRREFFNPADITTPPTHRHNISDETVERMDIAMIARINAVVGRDDELYHLGDFAWHKSAKSIRDRINCQNMHLIWGNHDKPDIADLFTTTQHILEIEHERQHIVMCHYPMRSWNKSHRGSWNLYGHVHGALDAENRFNRSFKGCKANTCIEQALSGFHLGKPKTQDVGVDSHAFHPWSFEQLKEVLS